MHTLRAPAPATPQIIPAPGDTTPVQLGQLLLRKHSLALGDLIKIGISAVAVAGTTVQDTINFYMALDDVFLIGGGQINLGAIRSAGDVSFATFWQEGMIGYSGRFIFSLVNNALAVLQDGESVVNPYTSANASTVLVDTLITGYDTFSSTTDGAFFIPNDGSAFDRSIDHTLKVFAAWADGTDPTNTIQLENFILINFRPGNGNTSNE